MSRMLDRFGMLLLLASLAQAWWSGRLLAWLIAVSAGAALTPIARRAGRAAADEVWRWMHRRELGS